MTCLRDAVKFFSVGVLAGTFVILAKQNEPSLGGANNLIKVNVLRDIRSCN